MKRRIQGCSRPVLQECDAETSTGHGCQVPEIMLVCTLFVLCSPWCWAGNICEMSVHHRRRECFWKIRPPVCTEPP